MQGRKALMALKGVVRLQAVVRGQNTRRLILTRLKSLQSIAKPQVHQIIIPQKVLVNKDNKVPVLACYGLDGILCVPYLYQFWELNLVYICVCMLLQSYGFYLFIYYRLVAQLVRTGRTA